MTLIILKIKLLNKSKQSISEQMLIKLFIFRIEHILLSIILLYKNECATNLNHIHLLFQYSALKISIFFSFTSVSF